MEVSARYVSSEIPAAGSADFADSRSVE